MNESYGLSMTKGRMADALRYVKAKKEKNPLQRFTVPPRSKKQRIRLKHQKRVRRYIDHCRAFLREKGFVSPPEGIFVPIGKCVRTRSSYPGRRTHA